MRIDRQEIAKIIIERAYAWPQETTREVAEFASFLEKRPITPAYITLVRREIKRGKWPRLVARYEELGWMTSSLRPDAT